MEPITSWVAMGGTLGHFGTLALDITLAIKFIPILLCLLLANNNSVAVIAVNKREFFQKGFPGLFSAKLLHLLIGRLAVFLKCFSTHNSERFQLRGNIFTSDFRSCFCFCSNNNPRLKIIFQFSSFQISHGSALRDWSF